MPHAPSPAPLPIEPVEIAAGAWQLVPPTHDQDGAVQDLLALAGPDPLHADAIVWCVRQAVGGSIVGVVTVRPSADGRGAGLSVVIAPEARGAGAARTAVGAVGRYLRDGAGLSRIVCASPNAPAARSVARAAGIS